MNVMKPAALLFERKLNLERIDRHLDCILFDVCAANPGRCDGGVIVACVQREIKPIGDIEQYIDDIAKFVRQASEKGAKMIVFPEYNFFDMFGFIPFFSVINKILCKRAMRKRTLSERQETIRPRPRASEKPEGFGAFFMEIAVPVERAIHRIMSRLACAYGIVVYSGSIVTREHNRLYNAGCVFGTDGACLCTQKKMHLTDAECEMGMSRGECMEFVDLPFGRAAFPICMDATYFETFRIAMENGVDIVALPISNGEEYDLPSSLRGIWGRVMESYVFGLKASQNGWIAGMHFTGIAGIFAPLEMTPGGDGLLASSPAPEGDSLVIACLDIEELHSARTAAAFYGDRNPAFEREYVRRVYQKDTRGG